MDAIREHLAGRVVELERQRAQLREVLENLLASHEDLTNWAEDPSIGRPDIEWSLEFAGAARAALKATEEDV